jgi:hypothetical protein
MRGTKYQGCAQRTFKNALINMLEKNYGLLGSRRVLSLLAEDVEALIEEFYPSAKHLSSGWMLYTATLATDTKVRPGFRAGDHELDTIAWPLLTIEDVDEMAALPSGRAGQKAKKELQKKRLLRLVEHGLQHEKGPLLLTLADLSLMTGITTNRLSRYLQELREETGRALPTKGYHFDQGMRPTHKKEIIELYEAGVDEADIAVRTGHSQNSVGRYIRDYERVKLLLTHKTPRCQISTLIERQENVVQAYIKLLQKHHPEIVGIEEKPL